MFFNSLEFFAFSAVFFPLYFLTKGRIRLLVCLLGSYFFYACFDWRFLVLLMCTTALDYSLGMLMDRKDDDTFRGRVIIFSVFINLLILSIFKYFNFFVDSAAAGLAYFGIEVNLPILRLILPVGISFYTFQSMSYTIDIYRREIMAERDPLRFATFVAFFPQLLSGPIVRARDFLPQFQHDKEWSWDNFWTGLGRVLWGFFKKMVVADSLGPFIDQAFAMPEAFSAAHLIVGIIFYSFQIYCDFSGYTDIAIGLARIMGFKFSENFKTPYFSTSFSEFWTRWHISLSSWLRDYLYISMGGNRNGKFKTSRNLMYTMLLGGLWHGANGAFILWGFLHGAYLVIQRLIGGPFGDAMRFLRFPKWLQSTINMAIVYFLTCFAWIYFRAGSMGSKSFEIANKYIGIIAEGADLSFGSITNKFVLIKGVLVILLLLSVEIVNFRYRFIGIGQQQPWVRTVTYGTLLLLIAALGTFGSSSFIYFQF